MRANDYAPAGAARSTPRVALASAESQPSARRAFVPGFRPYFDWHLVRSVVQRQRRTRARAVNRKVLRFAPTSLARGDPAVDEFAAKPDTVLVAEGGCQRLPRRHRSGCPWQNAKGFSLARPGGPDYDRIAYLPGSPAGLPRGSVSSDCRLVRLEEPGRTRPILPLGIESRRESGSSAGIHRRNADGIGCGAGGYGTAEAQRGNG